jgi:rubrerythrin
VRRSEAKPSRAAVDAPDPRELAHSRREALRRGAVAAAALAATGLARPALAAAQSTDDEDLRDFLVEAIGLEQVTVLAYSTAADATDEAALKATLERFRDQEQAHANALLSAIDEVGFDPPEAPDSPTDTGVFDDVDGLTDEAAGRLTDQLDQLQSAKTPNQYLDLLSSLETDQLTYYAESGPALDSSDLSTTSAEIAGCQAQHLVALGLQAGHSAGAAATAAGATAARAAPTAHVAE